MTRVTRVAARVLFSAPPESWPIYQPHLLRACAAEGIAVDLTPRTDAPAEIGYIVHQPGGPVADFTPFTGLKAVLSLWAGVERIASDPTLRAPLCRMVDEGLIPAAITPDSERGFPSRAISDSLP